MIQKPISDLERLQNKSASPLTQVLIELGTALYQGNLRHERNAELKLAELLRNTMIIADMLGREAAMRYSKIFEMHYEADNLIIPKVPAKSIIEDIVSREPMVAKNYRQIQDAYSDRKVFAMVRATNNVMLERVQRYIVNAIRQGKGESEAKRVMADITDFSQAYTGTVYRTNIATAFSAGQWKQMTDPDVEPEFVGFKFEATMDSDTRPNHAAANGFVAGFHDDAWYHLSAPLGYSCRCSMRPISLEESKRMGLRLVNGQLPKARIPAGAGADKGFRVTRPDISFYGMS